MRLSPLSLFGLSLFLSFLTPPVEASHAAANFGSVSVGSSGSVTITIPFASTPSVAPNLSLHFGTDFSLTGTCPANSNSCSLPVTFSPTKAGLRQDAVIVKDATSGAVLAEAFVYGNGSGPQVTVNPTTAHILYTGGAGESFNEIASDAYGNLYITTALQTIEEIALGSSTPVVVAGQPSLYFVGSSGDGGPATSASLDQPSQTTIDSAGNIYFVEGESNSGTQVVRRVDGATGVINTVVGSHAFSVSTPEPPDGSLATSGNFDGIAAIALDLRGDLYIATPTNIFNGPFVIRKIDAITDIISTIAGGASSVHSGDGGPAAAAGFGTIFQLLFDGSGNLYVSEGDWIRKIDAATQIITTIAGNGGGGSAGIGGPAVSAEIDAQIMRIDAFGNLYVNNETLDFSGSEIEIQKIDRSGVISDFAGLSNGARPAEGLLSNVVDFDLFRFDFTFDSNGNYYVLTPWPYIVQFNTTAPSSYSFLTAGTSSLFPSPLTVALTNSGDQSLSIASADVTGSFQIGQSATQGCTFPAVLATSASCLLSIQPILGAGNSTGSLTINSNSSQSGQAIGLTFAYPNVSLSRASLNFGAQQLGLPSYLNVDITNSALAPFAFDHASIQGPNAGDFTISYSYCPPNSIYGCYVDVDFTPAASGSRTATLLIYGNTQAPLSVPLSGVGSIPTLAFSSSALTLNQTQWGTSSSQTVTVTNNGQVPVTIFGSSTTITGPFTVLNGCLPANSTSYYLQQVLQPAQSCTLAISFQPSGVAGTFRASYTLNSTLPDPQPVISLVGISSTAGPALTFDALPVSFQAPRNEISAPVPMALTNSGNSPLALNSITLTGTQASDFHQFNDCPSSLAPGQGCLIWISYAPGAASALTAVASVSVVASGSAQQSQQITGAIMDSSIARVFIDSPSALSSIKGTQTISGWLSMDGQTLYGANLYIDNVPVGFASANLARPDVCTAYPNTGNCPEPGWAYHFDTTGFPDGVHTLTAVAVGNFVQTGVSVTFTIANGAASTVPVVDIDAPVIGQTLSGTATFSGWSLDSQGTEDNDISALIDGVTSLTIFTNARPDVCTALNKDPQICSSNGWHSSVDTRGIANGMHTLTVIADDYTHIVRRTNFKSVSFSVNNASSPLLVYLDSPAPNQTITNNVNVSGWAIASGAQIQAIGLRISGYPDSFNNFYYGLARPDVCAAYPGQPTCNLGFAGSFSTISVPNGQHTLELTAYLSNGTTFTSTAIPVTIANILSSANDQFLMNVETPASNAMLSGTATVSGWIADGLTLSPPVSLNVDNVPVALALPSFARPDVCNTYPWAQDCPNPGWTTAIDTTRLTDGAHTLTVTATASTGKRITRTIPFTANNSSTRSANGQFTNIESPAAASTISGAWGISGWAVSAAAPIQEVDILVDGSPVGTAQYGLARPDVCLAFPQSQSCPGVGWYFLLDTRTLSDGLHSIQVNQVTASGNSSSAQKVTVLNSAVPTTIQAFIDAPAVGTTLSGSYQIGGWALDTGDSLSSVAVNVDGLPQGFATYGAVRSDVCALFPGSAGCPNVGWYSTIDTTQFLNGAHTIDIVISSTHGHVLTLTRQIQIAN